MNKEIKIKLNEDTLERLDTLEDLVQAKSRGVIADIAINFLYCAANKQFSIEQTEDGIIIHEIKVPFEEFDTVKFFRRLQ